MLIARACRRALVPPLCRPYAAAAVAVRREDLQVFLQRRTPYTILPTPLPQDCTSEANDYWFSDSTTQDLMAVMDACLHNLYDVPRAKGIFDRLRNKSSAALEIRINAPNAGTFALMMLAGHRFPSHAVQSPTALLSAVIQADIPVSQVIADRAFTDDEEAEGVIKQLSKSAIDLNLPSVVSELSQAEALGVSEDEDAVPEARPVTKDSSVPFNLQTLRKHLALVALARRVLPTDVSARQKLLEDSVYDAAKERLARQYEVFAQIGIDDGALLQHDLQRWMWQWHCRLKVRLDNEIKAIAATEANIPAAGRKRTPVLAPYLMLVNADRLSMLTIVEIMRLQGSGGVFDGMKTTRALISVGKAVENEYKAQMCKKNNIEMGYHSLQERRVAAARLMTDSEGWTAPWSQAVRSQVGGILVECLIDVAEVTRTAQDKLTGEIVTEEQPAFHQSYEYQRGQKLGVIRLNPVVSARLSKDPMPLHPRHLPMLVKPRPWVNYNEGGYLHSKTTVMRFKNSVEQRSYLKHASDLGNMELVYAGLDVLGSTPWQINKRVFDVVLEVWNSGKRLGKMPPEVYDLAEPEIPPDHETDLAQRNVYLTRMRAYNQAKAANHSDRCSVNYKIEISRSFLGDTFYLPHNVDFRGRAYPIPPHLNHIGDDLSRGLLTFADKKPLGERGFRWLKIHLANLYGFDKAPFDERAKFADDHLEDIYDAALHPLTGRGWWKDADDPWQCLATCMELHTAIESGDPVTYESGLPVHQDGTCNGLQHYAALGGDDQGAQQVNLSAGDRPSDVYSYMLNEDAARGDRYAEMLKGKVTRKVVKQTVMTTVYGVTFVGAREQIEKQLKDLKDLPEEECWLAASYLAKKVLMAIGDLFTGAKHIQTWLNLCARLISKSIPKERIPEALAEHASSSARKPRKNAARSKSNLPQNRLKKEQMTSVTTRKQIFTALQTVYISDPNSPAEVNSMKQASAFPPNFIHSLDATHMMLTAIECRVQDLTFASVHDSYWTHACSIDRMSEIIRDTFIAVHSSDVLKRLHKEFLERYEGFQVPLVHLGSGQLVKSLRAAGSRIYATPEQARSLHAISDLLVVSDTVKSTVETAKQGEEEDAPPKRTRGKGKAKQAQEEVVDALLEDAPADGAPPKRALTPKRRLLEKLRKEMEAEEAQAMKTLVAQLAPAPEDAEEDAAEAVADAKKAAEAKELAQLMGKFVNLTDLLPPLPAKGSFNVELIKDSPYFFS
ncbi:DNA/RNA polymerase [Mycena sp. CBHHK59/15]|nr:DNA/RNA polymerase [Mycena sp. CBHHK59/15]